MKRALAIACLGVLVTGCQYGRQSWTPPVTPNGYGVWTHDATNNGCNEWNTEPTAEVDNQGHLCKTVLP